MTFEKFEQALYSLAETGDEDELATLIEGAAATHGELAVRLCAVDALTENYDYDAALVHARAALELAGDPATRLRVTTSIAMLLREQASTDERAALLPSLHAQLSAVDDSEVLSRAHLELVLGEIGDTRRGEPLLPREATSVLHHAALASAHAQRDRDLARRHEATRMHAELLFERGDLAGAHNLVASLPSIDEDLRSTALLEHIERAQGVRRPLEVTTEVPPEVRCPPEDFVAFFARADVATMVRERRLASRDTIREWSHGRVRSELDLVSPQIFGPVRDLECACGRYAGTRFRGLVSERCGVELISASARARRPAHIELAQRVVHPWFLPFLAEILELPVERVRTRHCDELIARIDALRPLTSVPFLEMQRIAALMPPGLSDEVRRRVLRTATETERDVPELALFHEAGLRPQDMFLELIPVWPPDAELPAGVDRSKLRGIYVELLDTPPAGRTVDALFDLFDPRS